MPSSRRVLVLALLACASACSSRKDPVAEPAAPPIPRDAHGTLAIRPLDGAFHHVAANAQLRALFSADGVRLVHGETFDVHVTGFGRGGVAPVGRARVEERGLELRYVRPELTEWYANDPRGLEQGFDLDARPEGDGELWIDVSFDDATIARDGDDAIVRRRAAAIAVRGLEARDATGKALTATLDVRGSTLRIRVDDRDARYPLAIDPWYGAAPIALAASDGFSGVRDARIDGDTALVADPYREGALGAGYVFVRDSSGAWTQQQKLVTSPRPTTDVLGQQIALLADTAALLGTVSGTVVFGRTGTTWSVQQTIPRGTDGLLLLGDGGNLLVAPPSVAVSGAPSQTWVRSGATWSHPTGSDAPPCAGGMLSAKTLVCGNSGDSTKATWAGAVNVYTFDGATWSLQQSLYASDAAAYQQLGTQVAIAGDLIAAITQGYDVYFFSRTGTTWTQVGKSTDLEYLIGAKPRDAGAWIGDVDVTEDGLAFITTTGFGPGGTSGPLLLTTGAFATGPDVFTGGPSTWTPGFDLAGKAGFEVIASMSGLRLITQQSATIYELGAGFEDGTACTVGEECMSGFCIDGTCCDDPCGTSFYDWPVTGKSAGCRACSAALKGAGVDGVCDVVVADTDPHDECPVDSAYPASCKQDGFCDGTGQCRKNAKTGTACGATTCSAGSVTGLTCNGAGSCVSGTAPCDPYVCGASACKTTCATDDDCTKDAYCTTASVCAPKLVEGKACSAARECSAGYCVDGVCCESACNGQCQACAEKGTEGKCSTVTGAPRGTRPKCAGDPTCGGTCDGVNPAACANAPATKICSKSCKDGKASKATCDGAGTCADPALTACGAYACAGDVCGTTCTADVDCTSGYACKLGACVPAPKGTCTTDRSQSQSLDGTLTPCSAYLCDPGVGTCLTTCGTSADCAPGFTCDDKACNAPAASSGGDGGGGGGCGCVVAGSDVDASPWAALALALVALRRRRR